jgi:hypothetical protein
MNTRERERERKWKNIAISRHKNELLIRIWNLDFHDSLLLTPPFSHKFYSRFNFLKRKFDVIRKKETWDLYQIKNKILGLVIFLSAQRRLCLSCVDICDVKAIPNIDKFSVTNKSPYMWRYWDLYLLWILNVFQSSIFNSIQISLRLNSNIVFCMLQKFTSFASFSSNFICRFFRKTCKKTIFVSPKGTLLLLSLSFPLRLFFQFDSLEGLLKKMKTKKMKITWTYYSPLCLELNRKFIVVGWKKERRKFLCVCLKTLMLKIYVSIIKHTASKKWENVATLVNFSIVENRVYEIFHAVSQFSSLSTERFERLL